MLCQDKKIINVDRRYKWNVRPISECQDVELAVHASIEVVAQAKALGSENVIAPLGSGAATNEEVLCCCDSDKGVLGECSAL